MTECYTNIFISFQQADVQLETLGVKKRGRHFNVSQVVCGDRGGAQAAVLCGYFYAWTPVMVVLIYDTTNSA